MKRLRLLLSMHYFLSKVGADGLELPFCYRWMNKITKNYKYKKVPFLRWLMLDLSRNGMLWVVPQQTIDVDFLMRKYPYLPRDVLEKVASVKPRILIGKDNQTLMVAREVVEPNFLGLMNTKTKLSSIVHGGDNGGSIQEATTCSARRNSEEKRLSLKMMADTIQNVVARYEVALPYQNDVD
jgi:hypothetical protein